MPQRNRFGRSRGRLRLGLNRTGRGDAGGCSGGGQTGGGIRGIISLLRGIVGRCLRLRRLRFGRCGFVGLCGALGRSRTCCGLRLLLRSGIVLRIRRLAVVRLRFLIHRSPGQRGRFLVAGALIHRRCGAGQFIVAGGLIIRGELREDFLRRHVRHGSIAVRCCSQRGQGIVRSRLFFILRGHLCRRILGDRSRRIDRRRFILNV